MICINEKESLFDLIQEKQKLTKRLKEISEKIKALETSAKTGNCTIRLM